AVEGKRLRRRRVDDQRCRQTDVDALAVVDAVIPPRARRTCLEVVLEGRVRWDQLVGDPVNGMMRGLVDAVPVNGRRRSERVVEADADTLALPEPDLRPGNAPVVCERADDLAWRQLPPYLASLETNLADAAILGGDACRFPE